MERACGLPPDHKFKPNSFGVLRSKGEKEMEKGLLERRVVWTGNLCEDYWIYLKNNHAVLGIFLVHVLDPFNRWERVVIFFCGICWSILSAAVTLEVTANVSANEAEVRRAGYAVLFGLVVYIFTSLMKRFALCGAGTFLDKCCGAIGHFGMCFGASLAIGMLILGIFIAIRSSNYDANTFWTSFFISQIVSWVSGFVIGFLAYCVERFNEQRKNPPVQKKEEKCIIS